jgi:AcrR family transcriptional regulator
METTFRTQLVHAARGLFLSKGYESVGMREIAQAVGKAPTQVYRLGLSKTDILAEIIIELNQEQIDRLPGLLMTLTGANAFERTCAYLLRLYESDIEYMPVRAIGAAQGWTWSTAYEEAVTSQLWELLAPIVGWLSDDHVGDIPARCMAIWSLYYVGYRRAVLHGGTAADCLADIRPSLAVLIPRPPLPSVLSHSPAAAALFTSICSE